ncbi:hypothetical protein HRbin01_00401 [archaeon HR01]|nr:hypothetical protein HRbin01_00401 [archaeon HR01]
MTSEDMENVKLTGKDYGVFALIVAVLFVVILLMGDFGMLYKPLTAQTARIAPIYQFIYISGAAVGSLFMGALFWMIWRFREKEGGG